MPGGYGSHRDYMNWVKPDADTRQEVIETALREAFSRFIERREAEVVVFSSMSAMDLSKAILAHPLILKPLLACCNIAARAIERDLDINRKRCETSTLNVEGGQEMKQETYHRLVQGDARGLFFIDGASVHLVVTSPPYWTLKRYREHPDQMGHIADYAEFIEELSKVWRECYRVLVPGGRLVCVVGDVCLSRREHGRHVVVPLHADIAVSCRRIGFDNLNPIIWHKIANARYEVDNGSTFLGKPYEPNAIIKNDIEFILMQRKPGGYRKPTAEQRRLSMIGKKEYEEWFRQFWHITGASTREHPAPFPLELAYRLVRMFSFFGDTVLDPFCGTGTTMLAAIKANRNSIGVEVDPTYCAMAIRRMEKEASSLFENIKLEMVNAEDLRTAHV